MNGTIDGELATVISSVSLACKQIASLVNRAGISNLTGVAGNQNVQVRDSPWSSGRWGARSSEPGSWPDCCCSWCPRPLSSLVTSSTPACKSFGSHHTS